MSHDILELAIRTPDTVHQKILSWPDIGIKTLNFILKHLVLP